MDRTLTNSLDSNVLDLRRRQLHSGNRKLISTNDVKTRLSFQFTRKPQCDFAKRFKWRIKSSSMMPLFRKTSVEPRINIHIMFQHAYEQGEMEKMWSGGSAVA